MHCYDAILKTAETRLNDAKLLLKEGRYGGAFYLAGYSVELHFKAKICRNFRVPQLFDFGVKSDQVVKSINLFTNQNLQKSREAMDEVRKSLKKHNLYLLLIYSGLKHKYDEYINKSPEIFNSISFLMNN